MIENRLVETIEEEYHSATGHTIKRELTGCSPASNPFAGRWVLRDSTGAYMDHDQYRHDLMERAGFSSTPLSVGQFLTEQFK